MAQELAAERHALAPDAVAATVVLQSGQRSPLSKPDLTLCARLFWCWLAVRTAVWTVLSSVTQPNAPLDLIEWLAWGHEWQWGYPKHPPFPSWVGEAFAHLSPGGVWGVYLAGYLVTAVCLWTVWRLGRELLPPRLALAAVVSLEGLIYLNHDAAEFNNNVVLNACWAACILCFHRALRSGRMGWWLGLGLAAGLGLLSKYTIAFLFAPMLVYIVMDRESRCRFLQPGPYLAALIALGLFAPHVFWMARNDFITIHYGLERSADKSTLMSHFKNPVLFSLSQFYRLLPVVFVLLPLIPGRWRFRTLTPDERRDRDYLLFTVAGPVGLLLLVSFVTGGQIREIWGSPLWAFVGLLLLVALRLDVDAAALARARGRFALVAASFVVFALLKNYCEPALWKRPGRIHFPGPQLAEEVTRLWAEHSARPFAIVGGECWIAGNISFYALHRPSMYSSGSVGYPVMEARATPWTSDADMSARGGILVWDAARTGDDLPAEFRQRFPAARLQQVLVLPYQCLSELPPVRVGLAFVLPGESTGGMVAASVSSSQ